MKEHHYKINLRWTGNTGEGTKTYQSYSRDHLIHVHGKPALEGSSDPSFRGDAGRYNPEELFVSALTACHMLWYLHLCAVSGIVVAEYIDDARGTITVTKDGNARFSEVVLHPKVVIANKDMIAKALQLHSEANRVCYIANSCNFNVRHMPEIT
jgi:organic hydroperoxide reductase OsmC/OhrA